MINRTFSVLLMTLLFANVGLIKAETDKQTVERKTNEEQAAELIERLHANRRHLDVCSKGLEALKKGNLKPKHDAQIRYRMAQSLEALPGMGRFAKEKYGEILEMHPSYHRNVKISCRLAQLNHNIFFKGTQRNTQRAIECYEYVIEETKKRKNPLDKKIYYETLKAHMGLGNIYLTQGEYDLARRHFEVIYLCNLSSVVPLPHDEVKAHGVSSRQYQQLRKQVMSLKSSMPKKIVVSCVKRNLGETKEALVQLIKRYEHDPVVKEIAEKRLQKISEFEEKRKEQEDITSNQKNENMEQ